MSSTQLFDRQVVVTVGKPAAVDDFVLTTPNALRIEGLRVDFKVEKDLKAEPNKSTFEIYNLSKASQQKLEAKGNRIVVEAGYPGNVAQIFSGDIRRAITEKKGPDWVTKIECGDGERALNFATVFASFRPEVLIRDAVVHVAKSIGLDASAVANKVGQLTERFTKGHVVSGNAAQNLTQLLEPLGFSWSVQDGRIELVPAGGFSADEGIVINPDTGLIGSPEMGTPEKKGGPALVKVKALLTPAMRPGMKFLLQHRSPKNYVERVPEQVLKVRKLTHQGSTHGGDFYTEMACEAVST